MQIDYSKTFLKQYSKLPQKVQLQTDKRILLWRRDPSSSILHDHALFGEYRGYRSINITGDIRALYIKKGNTVVIFGFIGTHSQLY